MNDDWEDTEDVDEILHRQDEAMALLERLRSEEPLLTMRSSPDRDGRRDFRRWPTPQGVTLELHDGTKWHSADVADMGIGGARLNSLPAWMKGPAPARLKAPGMTFAVLVLADVMWRDKQAGGAGVRYEFFDNEDRDQWAGGLIDALLARFAVG